MNELEFERLARRAAASVRDEADRVADSRSALATLLVSEPSLTTASEPLLVEPEPDRSRRRELWMPMLAVAAAAIVVGGIVLLARDDDGSIVVTTEPPTTVSEVTTVPQLVTPDEPPESTQPSPTTTLADVAPPSIDEPIVIPDETGPQLARTVLAAYAIGDGPGELGFEDCQECEPVRPFPPVVADDGTILVADAFNDRWQVFRDGTWASVPYRTGETVIATPAIGPDGLLYAMVADDLSGRTGVRVVAHDPSSLEVVASYVGGNRAYPSVDIVGDEVVVGDDVVHRIDLPLGFPTWGFDRDAHEVTLALSGIARTFRLPERWEPYTGTSVPEDGSIVFYVWAPTPEEGRSDRFLLRLWPDGTWATGTIGANASTTNFDGRFSPTGWVQLEAAIVEYALPEFDGPDPLAGWAVPTLAPPDLDAVPRLLPGLTVPGTASTVRREWVDGIASRIAYVQTWARAGSAGDVDGLVQISTGFYPSPIGDAIGDDIEIPGWPKAYFAAATGDVNTLRLHSATRTTVVWTTGMTPDDVVALASSLVVDTDDVGWATGALSDRWTLLGEGWAAGVASRTFRHLADDGSTVLEMAAFTGAPDALTTAWFPGSEASLGEIGGRPALLVEQDGRSAITWSSRDGAVTLLGSYRPIDDLADIARSVVEVDQATWEAASILDASPPDGCESMFC